MQIDIMVRGKEAIAQADPMCESDTDVFTHVPGSLDEPVPLRTKPVRGEGVEKKLKESARSKAADMFGKRRKG